MAPSSTWEPPRRLRLRLFALVDTPDDDTRGGHDDEAYHRRNERPPVATLSLEPRFAKLRYEDHCFVRPASRWNLTHQFGQSVFMLRARAGNLRMTGQAETPPRQELRSTPPTLFSGTFRHKAP